MRDAFDEGSQVAGRMVSALQLGAGPGIENVVAVRTAVVGNPAFPVPAAFTKALLVAATGGSAGLRVGQTSSVFGNNESRCVG